MLPPKRIVAYYVLFALLATLVNIGTQDLVVRLYYGGGSIAISVICGTIIGLVVKYILDKRYIFCFETNGVRHNGKVFFLYSVMGLVTTAVFWGVEFVFQYVFETKGMRYVGGGIGLAIGYVTKYYLDKRFVFRSVDIPCP